MKIAAGIWRGRPLAAPNGGDIRPTSVRVRQALFDILCRGRYGDRVTGVVVLDAFAGTGALGLEALSQDAARATFMDNDPASIACVENNIASLGAAAHVIRADATRPPRAASPPAGLVFMDPPYGQNVAPAALTALAAAGWLAETALIVVETDRRDDFVAPAGFHILESRSIGPATVHLVEGP